MTDDAATVDTTAEAPPERDLNAVQKKRGWGHEKGWAWLTREQLDAICTHQKRRMVVRVFFRRRVKVLQCDVCKRRAMIFKGRRGVARVSQPDVIIDTTPMRLKP